MSDEEARSTTSEETGEAPATKQVPRRRGRSSALMQAMHETRQEEPETGEQLQNRVPPTPERETVEYSAPPQSGQTMVSDRVEPQSIVQPIQSREEVVESVVPQTSVEPAQEHEGQKRGEATQRVTPKKEARKAVQESAAPQQEEEPEEEEVLEKVTFYISLRQIQKLEELVFGYKKQMKLRHYNRNDVIREFIDQGTLEDLLHPKRRS